MNKENKYYISGVSYIYDNKKIEENIYVGADKQKALDKVKDFHFPWSHKKRAREKRVFLEIWDDKGRVSIQSGTVHWAGITDRGLIFWKSA